MRRSGRPPSHLSATVVGVVASPCLAAVWPDERSAGLMKGQEPPTVGRHSEQIVARQGAAQQGGAHRVVPSPSSAVEASGGFPVPLVTTSAQELPLLQVAGEPSLGSQDRGRTDLPELRAPFRGSMAGARAVLDDDKLKEDAIWALRQAFYANTSRRAQSQKRRDVEDLARRAAGGGDIYPLQERTVLGVAAALRASGFKSADSYMGELRQGRIEARFEVSAWLSQCKRALLRGRGPKNKAAELRFQDLVADAESLRGDFALAVPHVRRGQPLVASRSGGGWGEACARLHLAG